MLGTVGALILNIQIQNPLKIGTFRCSDLGWFSIKMLRTIATAVVLAIQKRNQCQEVQNGAGLHLEWSGCLVLKCHSKSKPSTPEQLLTIENPNVLCIRAPTVKRL